MSIEKGIRLSHTLCFMFSGKAGVGKSFSSDLMQKWCNELGLKTFKSPFARGVKETAKFMGWDGKKDSEGRRLLQSIGNSGRVYNVDLWAKQTFTWVEDQVGYPYDAIFIDDWRFKNEYAYVVNHEGLYKPVSIRIEASDRELLVGTPEYLDVSETELDNFSFDRVVENPKNYPQYFDNLRLILMEEIKKVSIT